MCTVAMAHVFMKLKLYCRIQIFTQVDGAGLHKMLSAEEGAKQASWRKGCLMPSLKDE